MRQLPPVQLVRIIARSMGNHRATPEQVYQGMKKRLNLERVDRGKLSDEDKVRYDELVEFLKELGNFPQEE